MVPQHLHFGGGSAESILTPASALLLGITILLTLFLRRRYALSSVFVGVFLIPTQQVVIFAGLHFTALRLIVLAAILRWFLRGHNDPKFAFPRRWNTLDYLFIAFATCELIMFTLQWGQKQAFIAALGVFVDTCGGYCVLRSLISTKDDLLWAIKTLAIVACVLGTCMLAEHFMHRNLLKFLGGALTLAERDGKVRAQATFENYLTAGAFGATIWPLFVWLRTQRRSRGIAYCGLAGALTMAVTTVSSTPLVSCVAALVALALWPARRFLPWIRTGFVVLLLCLQLVMKAPVWALIARVDLTGSSSSYHRFMLVNLFLTHIPQWWLIGARSYTTWGFDMWDVCNQFVGYGLTGGIVTLSLFIAIFWYSFRRLGYMRRMAQRNSGNRWLSWCLGASLLATIVSMFGVSYFDQVQFEFIAVIAMISASAATATRARSVTARVTSGPPALAHELVQTFREPVHAGVFGLVRDDNELRRYRAE